MAESVADLLAYFRGWDLARIAGNQVPGIYDRQWVDVDGVAAAAPTLRCAGLRVNDRQAQLYLDPVRVHLLTTGDTVEEVITHLGETEGPFTLRVLQFEAVGEVLMILEDQ